METYSHITRFIFVGSSVEDLIPALRSRCIHLRMNAFDMYEYNKEFLSLVKMPHSDLYDESAVGVSCSQALAEIYGQFDNGLVIKGPAVFGEAYRRAGLPTLAWVMSRKTLAPLLALGYRFFAKHRHRISKLIGPTALWLVGGKGAK